MTGKVVLRIHLLGEDVKVSMTDESQQDLDWMLAKKRAWLGPSPQI
jgi:hypothetical protein